MAGREYDQESALYYMRYRYYDPDLGRFLSEDPIGITGGLNLYAYAGNDPLNHRDPTGLDIECISSGGDMHEWTAHCVETSPPGAGIPAPHADPSGFKPGGGASTVGPNSNPPSRAGAAQIDPSRDPCALAHVMVWGGIVADGAQLITLFSGVGAVTKGFGEFTAGALSGAGLTLQGGVVAARVAGFPIVAAEARELAGTAALSQVATSAGVIRGAAGLLAVADVTGVNLATQPTTQPFSLTDLSLTYQTYQIFNECREAK